ncbi:post-GPI attachment to proteins factor 2-like isoform X3 [Octopus sinensis]|uniref:Post-GPI attachment to proteins factor 2-like isoform X3 n=1 Tax=Octopus sinensis TaxID=2607531 RepID=A0A7E6F9J1_9MOLL|nr:post-GPI attachment to proteins factor 2-like isoform X3 [Octopus sinensis]
MDGKMELVRQTPQRKNKVACLKKRKNRMVPNYLPSISAAIGGFTPQRYVWRACIGLHCAPRFLVAFTYYNFHMSVRLAEKNKLYGHLAAIACVLHIIENLALLGLTYVASNENHYAHEKFFITFLVSSLCYMLLTIILVKWGRTYDGRTMSARERKSYSTKFTLFVFNISCCFIAAYVYWRHNKYCEPGVYSIFALIEYLMVFSNITFHGYTWLLDYNGYNLCLIADGSLVENKEKKT